MDKISLVHKMCLCVRLYGRRLCPSVEVGNAVHQASFESSCPPCTPTHLNPAQKPISLRQLEHIH